MLWGGFNKHTKPTLAEELYEAVLRVMENHPSVDNVELTEDHGISEEEQNNN